MSARSPAPAILARWKLLLVLAVCALGVYLLLPDDAQLIEDLLRDGKGPEARRQLDRVTPAERQRQPNRYRRLELQLARQQLPEGGADALRAYWRNAVATWRESGFDAEIFAQVHPVIGRLPDVAAAWAVVTPELPRVPPAAKSLLTAEFIRAALAAGQPAIAAQVFAASHPPAERQPAEALELARLWELAGSPQEALAALGDGAAPELADRRLALLRALNRNREVLALLRARADAHPNESLAPSAVEEIVTVALQAGQPAEAVPYLQRRLAAQPDDLAAWRRLRDLWVAAGTPALAVDAARRAVTLGGQTPDDLRAQGRILEWAGAPADAFATWLVLAERGELDAIDRLIALNPGLYRDSEVLRVLARIVPVAGRPEYTLRLARLEVSQGHYDDAVAHFTRYLADRPDEADVILDLGRVLVALNRFAEAETQLRRAERIRPSDTVITRELASVLVFAGRHTEALALFGRLAESSPDDESLEAYTRLAESLGRYDEMARGLRRRIDQASAPAARDYLMLAYAHELGSDPKARRRVLEEGLQRLPQNDDLRLQLASALADERRYGDAQAVLAVHHRLREDPIAAALYLELMRLNGDTAAERGFLAVPLAGALALDENVREHAALAHEALHHYALAETLRRALLSERPDDPGRVADLARVVLLRGRAREAAELLAPLLEHPTAEILRLAAEVALAAGRTREAERHQLAYLRAITDAPATEWSALGDIRLARGDRAGARRAYTEALRRLQAQVFSRGSTP